ncbi:hypothetical protein BDR04DRAFT_1062128, partial [Suillus decipiens]
MRWHCIECYRLHTGTGRYKPAHFPGQNPSCTLLTSSRAGASTALSTSPVSVSPASESIAIYPCRHLYRVNAYISVVTYIRRRTLYYLQEHRLPPLGLPTALQPRPRPLQALSWKQSLAFGCCTIVLIVLSKRNI